MSRKTLFIFDVDGTLMRHGASEIDASGRAALETAAANGSIILASARPCRGVRHLLTQGVPRPAAIVGLNGAVAYVGQDINPLFELPLPGSVVKSVWQEFGDVADVWAYSAEDWFASSPSSPGCSWESSAVGFSPERSEPDFVSTAFLKLTVVGARGATAAGLRSELENYRASVSWQSSNPDYLEIVSISACHGSGRTGSDGSG